MSKGNTFENDLLQLIFNNVDVALVGDAAGLQNSAAAGNLYVSLHTSDPGETGTQTTNEIAYTGYARVAVPRTTATPGWAVSANSVSPTQNVTFPISTGGAGGTVTHFGVGCVDLATGAGKLLYSGTVTPNIVVSSGVTPYLDTSTAITED